MDIDPFSHVSLREHLEEVIRLRIEGLEAVFNARLEGMDKALRVAVEARGDTGRNNHWLLSLVVALASMGVALFALRR